MSIIAHIHNADGQDIGYVCGPPEPDAKGRRLIRHAPGCPRKGKPFIRTVMGEFGSERICYACKRVYHIIADWGDGIDGTRLATEPMPDDWWGWRHAKANEVRQLETAPAWVQNYGRGLVHLLYSYGFLCGREPMSMPFAVEAPLKRTCSRCARIMEART